MARLGFSLAKRLGWFYGLATGAVMGLVDSTIGWAISWTIGPGKPETEMNAATIGVTIVFVIIFAGMVGMFGGLLSNLMKRHA